MKERDVSGNLSTWSVIIGALLGVLLFLGAALAKSSLGGVAVVVLLLVYVVVLSVFGHINVPQVLWGRVVDENDPYINQPVVLQATVVVSLATLGFLVYDLLTESDWGWFSWIASLIAVGYLLFVARHAGQDTGAST